MNQISSRRTRLASGLVPLAALLIAACGSSHSPSTHSSTGTASAPTTESTSTPSGPSHKPSAGHKKPTASTSPKSGSKTTRTTTKTTSVPLPNPNPPAEPGCPKGVVPCVTKSTKFKPRGSPYIDINLEQAIARNQPAVKSSKVTCPSSTAYPVHCTITGTAIVDGKLEAIKGKVTVLGVETSTRTYAYGLLYRPAHG